MFRVRYFLRLALRSCIAFVLIFSILFLTCASEIKAEDEIIEVVEEVEPVNKRETSSLRYTIFGDTQVDFGMSYYVTFEDVAPGRYWFGFTNLDGKSSYLSVSGSNVKCTSLNTAWWLYVGSAEEIITSEPITGSSNGTFYRYEHLGYQHTGGDLCLRLELKRTYSISRIDSSLSAYASPIAYWNLGYFLKTYMLDEDEYSLYLEHENKKAQEYANELLEDNREELVEIDDSINNLWDTVSEFFGDFFGNLANAIGGLFVPEDGYFEEYFQRLNDFFSDKLGFLYEPFRIFENIINYMKTYKVGSATVTFPELKFQEYTIIKKTDVDLQAIMDEFSGLQEKVYFVTNVILIGSVLRLLQNKLKGVMSS